MGTGSKGRCMFWTFSISCLPKPHPYLRPCEGSELGFGSAKPAPLLGWTTRFNNTLSVQHKARLAPYLCTIRS